jgi:hypothetical protein
VPPLPERFNGVTVAVRVAPGENAAAAVADLARRGARTGVHVMGVPSDADPALAADAAVLVIEPGDGDLDQLAFGLKRALAAARGQHPSLQLLVAVDAPAQDGLRARGVEPYLDAFIAPSHSLSSVDGLFSPIESDRVVVQRLAGDAASVVAIASAAAAAADWFPSGLVAVPDRPLMCADRPLATYLNPQALDLVATSETCPAGAAVTGDIAGALVERREFGAVSGFRQPTGAGDRFAEGVTVGGTRALTVEEVIARHQAAAARQAQSIRTDIATGSLTLTFEAPGFVAPIAVTSQTTIFRDEAAVDLQQHDIRVNGVPFEPKDGVPHLPIIEPERVAVAPLTITLTRVYRYSLDGRDTVDGRPCYVVTFRPQSGGASGDAGRAPALFSGRAWIDAETFAMVRVSAAQTGLTGPIVASEQTDSFARDADGRWLLARSDIHQTYEGASVRTPIHRLLAIDRHEIHAPDFAARKRAAYASTDVILHDTPEGFRYLKREASPEPQSGEGGDLDALRSIAGPVTRIKTLAAGVIVDPNISIPLPFAGLSYVDFDLFGTGTQFSGFFGGSYAQLAFSAPSVGGSRWQLAGRAFAIATSYNDRAFVEGREISTRDIRQRPAQVSLWTLRPITPRAALRFEYDWDYNRFDRGDVTDPAFVIPANQNAHGLRAGLDLQVAGWQTSLWASHTLRAGWRRWGMPGSSEDTPARSSFQRFGASLLRTASLSPRVVTRIDASVVAGRDLDRFSRIAFGSFDNRLHGYPSALIRYDRGAVLRTALSVMAARAIRVDGFADTAMVHDPAFGRGLRNYTGLGAALECPAPFRTLVAVEWGYGLQGVNTDGRTGTHVVRITGYKVF